MTFRTSDTPDVIGFRAERRSKRRANLLKLSITVRGTLLRRNPSSLVEHGPSVYDETRACHERRPVRRVEHYGEARRTLR